ncbi:hypothetical protein [Paratissierella segnis]|jgi:hypothetical protein|nr:hypothetical protein [Paratissierella segnis]
MESLVNSVLKMLSNIRMIGFRRNFNQGIGMSKINIMLTREK